MDRRPVPFVTVVATSLLIAGCSAHTSAPHAAPPRAVSSPEPTLPSGELVIGTTPKAEAAVQNLCRAWGSIRSKFTSVVGQDGGRELDELVHGPVWRRIRTDARALGSDPRYQLLQADAISVGPDTVGDDAGLGQLPARLLDNGFTPECALGPGSSPEEIAQVVRTARDALEGWR